MSGATELNEPAEGDVKSDTATVPLDPATALDETEDRVNEAHVAAVGAGEDVEDDKRGAAPDEPSAAGADSGCAVAPGKTPSAASLPCGCSRCSARGGEHASGARPASVRTPPTHHGAPDNGIRPHGLHGGMGAAA
jgi:hypothetical protein